MSVIMDIRNKNCRLPVMSRRRQFFGILFSFMFFPVFCRAFSNVFFELDVARESIILLKNEDQVLPLWAETFIRDASQCPAHTIGTFGKKDRVEYREGVMVGYRYYDTEKTEILFPFGHGFSYTGFSYGDLEIVQYKERGKQVVKVSCTESI